MSAREYTARDFAKALAFCDAMGRGKASVIFRPLRNDPWGRRQFTLKKEALLDFGGSLAAVLDIVLEAAE